MKTAIDREEKERQFGEKVWNFQRSRQSLERNTEGLMLGEKLINMAHNSSLKLDLIIAFVGAPGLIQFVQPTHCVASNPVAGIL